MFQNQATGIPYFIALLYKHILRLDRENEYVFFQTRENRRLGRTRTVSVPDNGMGAFFFDGLMVNKLAKRERVDVLHGPSNILPFSHGKIRRVLTVHDLAFLVMPQHYSTVFYEYYRRAIRWSLRVADAIAADSKSTKEDIVNYYGVPENRVNVIYPGINDLYFQNVSEGISINDRYFLSLTTHPKRKNVLGVLKAMSAYPDIRALKFVIAGAISGEYLKVLRNQIRESGLEDSVIVLGYVSEGELAALYRNAEFFIYPSFYEGFGFPVLESMASRCPVITSRNSSLREVTPDAEWLVDPADLDDIYDKIRKLLDLPSAERRRLIDRNYDFATRFTWERAAQSYIDLLAA